ncbi:MULTISPECIES: bifunctional DNA-binding transcriptional regulator/O6-methylguanine-DNA methyltransferase Ada [unclassified Novosphingobium]|uniref:bifunctional DNA-binding transcriptional regulator/O6-methylguanine-DNA methyltransferase Ada n=1 Tax=unclassified Novosphingobium TaxID=2644732 RepID=UPI00086E5A7B|nr:MULTISPECIES: bifunctional DNA-binding transcriptional regulator/O6-methylguanine-DNA methyltransferase Ada [unclassified Novosphingobium]MBN9143854.1 bifunctional DNA-binding transcriptional regulator/O6-methylguanine-DNA methyltransferase Ada [Novosphingobium sp.]MDR6707040.1 AraC family transcriptional regulator of adaptative response/methylated-DNA-[protein]-cysteine methyltransferase [Novosphingobium sp. 1748]ODU84442.1 MAG: 6-O-methylguanine DNA methyltransferase [Novosphingobium sp. SC
MDNDQTEVFWENVVARDKGADGRFVFAVATTGIYCRPSCPARRPLRDHVRFFADGDAARADGFRPCLRCRPDEAGRDAAAIEAALRMMGDDAPSLTDLAEATGYSPSHFQRIFKRATGLSPAAYARARRIERAGQVLGQQSVTDAIYASGFGGPSTFYRNAKERMGMTPSAWAKGGEGVTIHWAVMPTTLGAMLVAATDRGICRLAFGVGVEDLRTLFPKAELVEGDEAFKTLFAWALSAVETPGEVSDIPLDVRGTAFQEAVWAALRQIPAGETRSYAQLAAAIGRPAACRAAGSANGANRVAVLIPCHRVIRGDGALGGYAWGEGVKKELLAREGVYTKE